MPLPAWLAPGCSSSTRSPPSLSAEPDGCPRTTSPAMTVYRAAHEVRFGYYTGRQVTTLHVPGRALDRQAEENKHFPCWTQGVMPGSAHSEGPGAIPLTACRAA